MSSGKGSGKGSKASSKSNKPGSKGAKNTKQSNKQSSKTSKSAQKAAGKPGKEKESSYVSGSSLIISSMYFAVLAYLASTAIKTVGDNPQLLAMAA